jgi:hypothetical protein
VDIYGEVEFSDESAYDSSKEISQESKEVFFFDEREHKDQIEQADEETDQHLIQPYLFELHGDSDDEYLEQGPAQGEEPR